MKTLTRRISAMLLSLVMMISLLSGLSLLPVSAATVNYVYSGNYVYNWGVRDTVATFVSPMAEDFYADNNVTYSSLAALSGSSSTSSVTGSALFKKLHTLMYGNVDSPTSYDATRTLFQYTDCQNSGKTSTKISSFYSGTSIGPAWDTGKTWNREHTWPNSRSESGSNSNTRRETDIMMLRPTATSENGSRSNTPYGEGNSYYDPNQLGQNVRGDVARIMLYVYTCWGTSEYDDGAIDNMWGSSGAIQSKAVLLKWMEEDPVDTWEMGRNDAVQAITGTRNVFVDYPELAFELFEESIPSDYSTPSNGGTGSAPATYAISASVNNGNYGSAYVSGNTIIATPATGYVVSSYTILSGTATVVRSGNVFTVTPNSDVSIRINFAANADACASGSYVFSDYAAGTQYAENEVHPLDSQVNLIVNGGYLNSQLRLYSSSSHNANAVIATTRPVSAITLSMAMADASVTDTLNVYTAEDDTIPQGISIESNSYKDYYLAFAQPTKYIKLDVAGINQARIQSMTLTFGHTYANNCDATCDVCGATRVPADHVYDDDQDSDCNVCGAIRAVDTPDTPVDGGTATITFDSTSKRTTLTASQQVWKENGITVTNNKGSSTSPVADYSNPARFYKNSELIVAYPGMTKIEFNCNSASYAADLASAISGATVSGNVVTVELDDVDSFTCTLSSGQVRIDSITVTYGAEEPPLVCDHQYTNACDADCNVCGATRTPSDHVYFNACDADCNVCSATRTPGVHTYTADCDTVCDICGAVRTVQAGGEATLTFDDTSKRTVFNTSQQVWEENGITVTNNKGSSTSPVADYSDPARFYKNSTLIVACPGMTKVTFTCSSAAYATTLSNSIKDTAVTVTVNGSAVTVELGATADSFTCTMSSGQVRVSSITTVGGAAPEHVYDDEYDPDCNVCGTTRDIASNRLYSDVVQNSAMETGDGVVGLAFKFELLASGATKDAQYVGDMSNATVTYRGQTCKVLEIGALMCNDATIGASDTAMVRENVEQFAMVDIEAKLLYQCEADSCFFAVRITNIPERHQGTVIYARPYCVIEYNGQQTTVYDAIASASYAEVNPQN